MDKKLIKKAPATCAVLSLPMSMTRLQNSSHARERPPLHTMKSRCVRTSRLKPRMYAWYTPIRSGSSGVQCWLR